MIYFDNAATTFPKPECVYKRADQCFRTLSFNAGRGGYKEAVDAQKVIDETRYLLGSIIGLTPEKVVFTSSATEATNFIVNGIDFNYGDNVYVSPFEHNSILRSLNNLKQKINIIEIPFNKETWEPIYDKFSDLLLLHKPKAVFLSHVSNVTGYILPYKKIFQLAKNYNAITILDCAQSFGVLNPSCDYTDFIIFAGHKSLYSMFGIGGFLISGNYNLNNVFAGGNGADSLNLEMPKNGYQKYEAGSPNINSISCLNESIKWLQKEDVLKTEHHLLSYFISKLSLLDNVIIYNNGNLDDFLGICAFNVLGYTADDVGKILDDEFGICVRTGYHCAAYVHNFLNTQAFNGCVRVSFGAFNTTEEIDIFIDAIKEL